MSTVHIPFGRPILHKDFIRSVRARALSYSKITATFFSRSLTLFRPFFWKISVIEYQYRLQQMCYVYTRPSSLSVSVSIFYLCRIY